MQSLISRFPVLLVALCSLGGSISAVPQLGSNFNHAPEIIDFHYLERAGVEWIRTTPRIFDYFDGKLQIENDPGLNKVIDAGERGYKVAFGFRWDFLKTNRRVPEPGSAEERLYFETAKAILDRIGQHVDVFKLGNEPSLETHWKDKQYNGKGVVPIVAFSERLLNQVVKPFYTSHRDFPMPDIYVGSLVRLFMKEELSSEMNQAFLEYAQRSPGITGVAIHLHISDLKDIETSLNFVRQGLPSKPIIVPEFSLNILYRSKMRERLGETKRGQAFAEKFGYDNNMRMHEWYSHANSNSVSQGEWLEAMLSRDWFPASYMQKYFQQYKRYGIVLATYPLLQQYCPDVVPQDSHGWFLNPIFCQKSLHHDNGEYATNPLCYEDFRALVEAGKQGSISN